jgi:N6-L-threonylcarbamoyladenine synthase
MTILAIESSCDETSVSVVRDSQVLTNIISSQYFHGKFGGVIPELASRAHLENISNITKKSISEANLSINDIDAIAVTTEPGLAGSLLVGSNFAKGLSIKYNKPIIPVNHIEGHIFSGCLQDKSIQFPFVTLVVSGGHTSLFYVDSYTKYEILGSTVDDAAGEAFDKIATLLGLQYPGGPEIDKLAKNGNPDAFKFPRAMINSNDYNFSFSGLKTSVRYFLHKTFPNGVPESEKHHLAASIQQAIVDVLVIKSINAAKEKNVKYLTIAGGVSSNSALRKDITKKAKALQIKVIAPELEYCIDNAAMIGFLAEKRISEIGLQNFKNLRFTINSSALRGSKTI